MVGLPTWRGTVINFTDISKLSQVVCCVDFIGTFVVTIKAKIVHYHTTPNTVTSEQSCINISFLLYSWSVVDNRQKIHNWRTSCTAPLCITTPTANCGIFSKYMQFTSHINAATQITQYRNTTTHKKTESENNRIQITEETENTKCKIIVFYIFYCFLIVLIVFNTVYMLGLYFVFTLFHCIRLSAYYAAVRC